MIFDSERNHTLRPLESPSVSSKTAPPSFRAAKPAAGRRGFQSVRRGRMLADGGARWDNTRQRCRLFYRCRLSPLCRAGRRDGHQQLCYSSADHVTLIQHDGGDLPAIDKRTVRTVEIDKRTSVLTQRQLKVSA